ncbi:MAG: response regulator [Candidatus Korobacteraceae bacterium]
MIDVVVLDYAMPGMNGAEVVTEIRKLRAKLPIIMLSGHHMSELPQALLGVINGFVSKGAPPGEIVALLRKVTDASVAARVNAARLP